VGAAGKAFYKGCVPPRSSVGYTVLGLG